MSVVSSGHFVGLADAARLLALGRVGKRPHVTCTPRWTACGCKGMMGAAIIRPSGRGVPLRGNVAVHLPARGVDNCQRRRVYFHG